MPPLEKYDQIPYIIIVWGNEPRGAKMIENMVDNTLENAILNGNNTVMGHHAAMAMGAHNTAPKQLTDAEKSAISRQMFTLFFGLTMANWAQNKPLGAAWHTSIQQMESFLASKDNNNLAVSYMKTEFARYRNYVARQSMTHPNRDMKLNLSPDLKDHFMAFANDATRSALDKLNTKFAEFTPTQTQEKSKNPYADAIKKVQALQQTRQSQTMMPAQMNWQQMMARTAQYGSR